MAIVKSVINTDNHPHDTFDKFKDDKSESFEMTLPPRQLISNQQRLDVEVECQIFFSFTLLPIRLRGSFSHWHYNLL